MLSVPLYRGWKFVKCQIERFKKKCILLFYFSRVHWGCHLLLKCFIWIYKKKNEMMWILLLVHITLHGMIGGLLKHFPKAVCGMIFSICKNIFECQKKQAVFLSPSQCHIYAHHEHKSNLSWESGRFLFFCFLSCDGSAGFVSLSFALIRKCSQREIAISCGHSGYTQRHRDDPVLSNIELLLGTLRHTNFPEVQSGQSYDRM